MKTYPKDLPSIGVVVIYLDEALSILKRAIQSIIDRIPKSLLKEIILVDDHSTNGLSLFNRFIRWKTTLLLFCPIHFYGNILRQEDSVSHRPYIQNDVPMLKIFLFHIKYTACIFPISQSSKEFIGIMFKCIKS